MVRLSSEAAFNAGARFLVDKALDWWMRQKKRGPRLRRRGTMLNLRIEVNVSNANYGGGGLHLREEIEMEDTDFLEMAKILGQFHDLAEKIKRERAGR